MDYNKIEDALFKKAMEIFKDSVATRLNIESFSNLSTSLCSFLKLSSNFIK